jgi:hypothetical protein
VKNSASPNSPLQPTRSAAFLPFELWHHRVADRAAEPWSVCRESSSMLLVTRIALVGTLAALGLGLFAIVVKGGGTTGRIK